MRPTATTERKYYFYFPPCETAGRDRAIAITRGTDTPQPKPIQREGFDPSYLLTRMAGYINYPMEDISAITERNMT
jgi:hypothetical protein